MAKRRSFAKHKGHKRTFFVLALVVLLAALFTFSGIRIPNPTGGYYELYGAKDMRYGIDIRGGVEAVFVPADYDNPTAEQMAAVQQILETRLDNLSIYDREIIPSTTGGRITVRYPWRSDESDFNPETAIAELGATARLTFEDEDGNVILEGSDVESAIGGIQSTSSTSSQNIVRLELKEAGKEKFAEATGQMIGKIIITKMDDLVINEATVRDQISDGTAIISGMETPEAAVQLANQINAGALPFAIEAISTRSISPQMGSQALNVMVQAGLVAFLFLCVYLILNFRLSGFVASFSLLAQIVGILLAISIPQQTLTMQGIAGIILSIGMGVDANVIVAERIREEVRGGMSIRQAVEIGYDRAFSSILDGNVTVAIAAACLIFFGSGSLLSFGYSLFAGVVLNLICGAWLSHYMTRSLVQFDKLRKPWFFGVKTAVNPETGLEESTTANLSLENYGDKLRFDFFKNRYAFLLVSIVLIVFGTVFGFINGVELDISFRGGSILQYSYDGELSPGEAEDVIQTALGQPVTAQVTEDFATSSTSLIVQVAGTESLTVEEQQLIRETLVNAFPDLNVEAEDIQTVDPFIGREMFIRGLLAILVASALIVAYVWIRFRTISGPSAGVFALFALLHDVIIAFLVFVVMRAALDDNVIAVVLSILGWSVNDTIVTYDRIRENARNHGKLSIVDNVNLSVHQSLSRSIHTSVCAFIAVAIAYVFALLYGIESVREFSLPMMIGIIAGSVSSILMASQFWAQWKSKRRA